MLLVLVKVVHAAEGYVVYVHTPSVEAQTQDVNVVYPVQFAYAVTHPVPLVLTEHVVLYF